MAAGIQDSIKTLMASKKIKAALDFLRSDHEQRVAQMKEIALTFGETGKEPLARSPMYHKMLVREGAKECRTDSLGNVSGYVYGSGGKDVTVLFEAHLDTVFPEGTPLAIREEGSRLFCPGIGDDAGGLTLNLSLLRAIRHAELVPVTALMVAGTACEEATGNFNGMRKLFDDNPAIAASVSIDGGGNERVCHRGVGTKRTEFIFRGPGGHSWSNYGIPMCMHAMCRAMSAVAAIDLPSDPKTTVNIGVVSGGDSAGAIAAEARVHVDMRSLEQAAMDALEKEVFSRVQTAVAMENRLRNQPGVANVSVEANSYADIPAAFTPENSVIVRTVFAASKALKLEADTSQTASTNANIPMSRGIPAVTLGYGGVSTGVHSLGECWDSADAYRAAQKALLVIFALAGLDGVTEPLVGKP
ncbi:putative Peptidase M20 [uncultured delta proteobacterium]|uniref:Putative Peptidase M20 n=1 Tax=uncultured delta proteobacterium TaxID=34034 RepID=A0A212IUF0_9DELT|nr:putative Peptidase M20 [uncultured delta proteobacterium]